MGRRSKFGMSRSRWGRERSKLCRVDQGHSPDPARGQDVAVVEMMSFEITDEPFDDPYVDTLSPALYDEVVEVINQEHRDPLRDLPRVISLIERGARVPKLYNYLYAGYAMSGNMERAREALEETCRLFPNYFFGRIENARMRLQGGDIEGAREALGGTFSLTRLCGSSKVHFTEFRTWCIFMCEFQLAEQQLESAESYRNMLASVAPENEGVEYMDHLMKKSIFEMAIQRLQDMVGPRASRKLMDR